MRANSTNKIHDMYSDNLNFFRQFVDTTYEVMGEYQHLWLNLIKPLETPSKWNEKERHSEGVQTKGDRFLSELSILSSGDQSKGFDMYLIGENLGFDKLDTESIVNNLSRAELIKQDNRTNQISITPYGKMIKNGGITVGYAPVH